MAFIDMSLELRESYLIFFFFSSRRRHTRFDCDWSSDVCSSDLGKVFDPRVQGMPMRRREFITLLGGMATAWPLEARAQRPRKFPFVGVLVSASHPHPFADAFWRGLHALGYSDHENIKVEFRYTDGRSDRAKEYAEELVRLSPDVIVAHYALAVSAAMAATRTIPIVMAPHGAP